MYIRVYGRLALATRLHAVSAGVYSAAEDARRLQVRRPGRTWL